jgi:hypothetical protein
MLAMGRALMGAPKLLMLDEPSLGLAPIIAADIFRTIGELRAAGVSVLLVEQNAQATLKIADRAYVMELGEFILSGSAKDIASNQRVAASYLGFQQWCAYGLKQKITRRPVRPGESIAFSYGNPQIIPDFGLGIFSCASVGGLPPLRSRRFRLFHPPFLLTRPSGVDLRSTCSPR